MKGDLADKMRKVRSDLEDLPQSFLNNPQAHLLSLCTMFSQAIDNYTNGKPSYPPSRRTFLQDNLGYYRALEKSIKRTRPQFEVAPLVGPPQCLVVPIVPSDDEKKEMDGTSLVMQTLILLVITLKFVRDVIEEMSTRELYGVIPFQVHEHFIESFVSKWESLCLESFDKVEHVLKAVAENLCDEHFGRFQSSGLLYDVRCGSCIYCH